MSRSLYIHIPFCLKRCIYCDFVSGSYDPSKADNYIDALIKEFCNIQNEPILDTLFIGGGTPTALSSEKLKDLMEHIFDHFTFTAHNETTIEANPGTLENDKLRSIRSAGINRISIGVQSFNDDELSYLGRIHTSDEAAQAVLLAQDSGFDNIGIDLIYGIPGQDIDSWKRTLEKAVRLKPQHISTYELTVEKGTELHNFLHRMNSSGIIPTFPPLTKGGTLITPLWQRGDRGDSFINHIDKTKRLNLLDENKITGMYEHTIDYLNAHGYRHYEISNFALPGYECKHNLNYWDRGEYYGSGLGAHSFINGQRFYNTDNLDEYIKLIKENSSSVKKSELITEEMALAEAIFLGLRKTEGLNIESFSRQYKKIFLSSYQKEIKELQEARLIEITESDCSYETNVKLTRKGMILSNEVFVKFI